MVKSDCPRESNLKRTVVDNIKVTDVWTTSGRGESHKYIQTPYQITKVGSCNTILFSKLVFSSMKIRHIGIQRQLRLNNRTVSSAINSLRHA